MRSLLFSGGRLVDISCLVNIINVIGQCFFFFFFKFFSVTAMASIPTDFDLIGVGFCIGSFKQ